MGQIPEFYLGHTKEAWASAIATRLSEEWCASAEEPGLESTLCNILEKAFCALPMEDIVPLIGTGLMEEDHLDNWE